MRSPLNAMGSVLALVVLPLLAYYTVPILVRFGYSTINFIDHAEWQELVAVLITICLALVVLGDLILLRRKFQEEQRRSKNNGKKQ